MATYTGTIENNQYDGTELSDLFFLQQGGDDEANGGLGADGFFLGATLTEADILIGGDGIDTVAIQGDYTNLVLGSNIDTDVLLTLSAKDNRFGTAASLENYEYNLIASDGLVRRGGRLTVQAETLGFSETLTFNGSAEIDGDFRIFAGRGINKLTGGRGNDGFLFGTSGPSGSINTFYSAQQIDGGAGIDSLAFRGNYEIAMISSSVVKNVEVLVFLSGFTKEYGGLIDENGFDYEVTIADDIVAAGRRMEVNASGLRSNETLTFEAFGETDGSFRVISGAGNDDIWVGAGNDIIFSVGGNDVVRTGSGSDTVDAGAGDDFIVSSRFLDATDVINGGLGNDFLEISGKEHLDADFTGVSNVESIRITSSGHAYVFGAQAQEAGINAVLDTSGGSNILDLSGISRSGFLIVQGGLGADTIFLGNVDLNLVAYNEVAESSGSTRDVVYNFLSGFDRVDIRFLDIALSSAKIEFKGNFAGTGSAQLALEAFDLNVDAVFDTVNKVLWFDVNDDGFLNDSDLSIVLMGVQSLQGGDVYEGSFIF